MGVLNWFKSDKKLPAKDGGVVPPAYIKKTNQQISDASSNLTNTDLTTLRSTGSTQKDVVKALAQNSPDASFAVYSKNRFAITDSYTVIAYTVDGKVDVNGTIAAISLANRLDKLPSYIDKYSKQSDFRSLSERALVQLQWFGSWGAQLILEDGGIPNRIEIFSTRNMKFDEKTGREVPYIEQNGVKYYLDSPLCVIIDIDQDVTTPYSMSPLQSATQPLIADHEFVNDLRRAFSKASLPRPTVKIIAEKFIESLTPDIRFDPKKLSAAQSEMISKIRDELSGLNPEDCLVYFDTMSVEHLVAGNSSSSNSVKEHKDMLDAKVSSGLHTLPSLLGRGASSTAASTEAMAYLRAVEGEQEKLNTMYSELLTVGTRLLGHDVYVDFKYADPELRPKSELESFRVTKQSRVMELLSFGFISDEEASIMLTGGLPTGNFTPLSGTRFRDNSAIDSNNPYSNTSVSGSGVNDTQTGKNNKADNQQPSSNKTSGK